MAGAGLALTGGSALIDLALAVIETVNHTAAKANKTGTNFLNILLLLQNMKLATDFVASRVNV